MVSPLPYGSWPTPIDSELVVRAAARLGEVVVDGNDVWWSEGRPAEGGRTAIVRRSGDGTVTDVLPEPWNARTRVHEYGGGAWTVAGGTLWFTEFSDQRLYRLEAGSDTPVAVTPEPDVRAGVRHADLRVVDGGAAVLAVRETHPATGGAAGVVNEIVRVQADGSTEVLVSGPDFVSDPRSAPDGVTLSWLQWDHPNMPWDAAQLVVRSADGTDHVLAGGPGESVVQPVWGADLALWWFSDRTDFWSLYRKRPHEEAELVVDVGGDIAGPAVGVRAESLRAARRRAGRLRLRPRRRRPARSPRGRRRRARGRRPVQRLPGSRRAGDVGRLRGRRPGQRAGGPAGRRRRRRARDPPPRP